MFWDRFELLCSERGEKTTPVGVKIGEVSSAAVVRWKKGAMPGPKILLKLAAYFGVSVAYLKGLSDDRNPPAPPGNEKAPASAGAVGGLTDDGQKLHDALVAAGWIQPGQDITPQQMQALRGLSDAAKAILRQE